MNIDVEISLEVPAFNYFLTIPSGIIFNDLISPLLAYFSKNDIHLDAWFLIEYVYLKSDYYSSFVG